MNTANKITLLRIVLVPVYVVLMLLDKPIAALIVFILAGLSDSLDGYIARHYNQITDFGKFADPLADKILILSALLLFVQFGQMPAWCAILILTREFAVTGLRLVAVEGGKVIAAGISGKLKTFFSTVGCCVMMTPWHGIALGGLSWLTLDNLCVAVMVILTLWSGFEYFAKNISVFRNMK